MVVSLLALYLIVITSVNHMLFRYLLCLLMLVCFSQTAHAAKLKVVTSFSILNDMTQQIGGEDIELTSLVGTDSNVHGYTPTPADAASLANADLVIMNGLGLEGWIDRLIQSSGFKGQVVNASDGIKILPAKMEASDDTDQYNIDFHAWQNAQNGKIYIRNIRNALIAADPEHKAAYVKRAKHMTEQLESLDQWIHTQFEPIPVHKRKLITTHNAFGYYAAAYDVTFIAPRGISTSSDPSAADMATLIDEMQAQHIRAIFLENISDDRIIKQLEQDLDAHIGGVLYSDALSDEAGPAPSYIALLKHNTMQLVHGIQHND